ncbi:hypothetical protein ACUY2X_08510 [Corynebacterium minutissimum]
MIYARGASPADAAELAGLHHVYFGPTRFTGKQRQARQAAVGQAHDLATLNLIEPYTAKLKKELDVWNLRIRLAATPAQRIPTVAKERLRKLRTRRVPEPGVRLTYRASGPHSLTITDSALRISEMRGRTLESINPADWLDAAGQVFFNRSQGGSKPAVATNVVVTLEELDKIVRGEGMILSLYEYRLAFKTHKAVKLAAGWLPNSLQGSGPLDEFVWSGCERYRETRVWNDVVNPDALLPRALHPKAIDSSVRPHTIDWNYQRATRDRIFNNS